MIFPFWYLITWTFLVLDDLNPVPIPGMTTAGMQQQITDFIQRRCHEGEGCRVSASTAEAIPFTAELLQKLAKSGHPPPEDSGPSRYIPTKQFTAVQKRSFKRACKRMLQFGHTWYQGRLVTDKDFPVSLQQKIQGQLQSRRPSGRPTDHQVDKQRLRVFQWNPGGMTQGSFLEFKIWLRAQQVDVAILSETRWSFTSTWSDEHWAYIHSASETTRAGGILVLIARKWVHPDQIGYHETFPGRILHVRLHFGKRSTDIVAVYQFADYRTKESTDLRMQFWKKLDEFLHTIPNRNQLICSGDFNCALTQQVPWCGTSGFRWRGQSMRGYQHRDQKVFQALLATHHLVALNSWQESKGPTYQHGEHGSRIDFICIRRDACDGKSKDVAYLNQAEIVPLNTTHHVPMIGSIRKVRVQYQVTRITKACSLAQREHCRLAHLQDNTEKQSLQRSVCDALQHVTATVSDSEMTIRALHERVIPTFQTLFPSLNRRQPELNTSDCRQTIQDKWMHHRAIHSIRRVTSKLLSITFQVWNHWSHYKRLQRLQQKQARQARAQRFHELCQTVQCAADQHDAHGMFKIINRYTPKKSNPKLRLRTDDGQLADQYASHSLLVTFVHRTWQGPRVLPKFSDQAPGVPFSVDQLCSALMRTRSNRAVAMPFLPAVIWQSAPYEVASFLHEILGHWWGQYPPIIPQDWKDAWLYFIPKPGKPCSCPENLRPISLMEPMGKIVLGLIAEGLKQHLEPLLCQFPQLGFLPMRGSLDAINRVSQHCATIRALVGNHRRTVARQMSMSPHHSLIGGVQMFLDLTRAFDCVDRSCLIEHLHDLQAPHDLFTIITHWHEGTRYHVVSPHTTTPIDVGLGLRQGCKIAPLLWLVYMSKLLTILIPLTGEQWIRECLTLYADDVHVGCQYTSKGELEAHLQCMGHLLDCIERLKLTLSYQKTSIIFAATGSNARRALKDVVRRNPQQLVMTIPRGDGTKTELPMKTSMSYLGTSMSYGAFELQTWLQRKRTSWAAFSRLKCWLRHRQISMDKRMYLWRTCVFSILTYGITATNATISTLQDFQTTIYQMIRLVLNDHSYRTGNTHMQVLANHGLPQPLELLQWTVGSLWQRIQRRQLVLAESDFLQHIQWPHLPELLHLICTLQEVTPDVPIRDENTAPQVQYKCQYCSFVTHTIPNLRRHCTTQHGVGQHRTVPHSILTMSLNGRAQCNHCHKEFTSWRRFKIHVERNCCQAAAPRATVPLPTLTGRCRAEVEDYHIVHQDFWPVLKRIITESQWHTVQDYAAIGEYLTHTCMQCGLWNNRCQEMNSHFRLNHADLVAGLFAKGAQITKLVQSPSPCLLCKKPFKRGHTCTVATQLAALQLHCVEAQGNMLQCDLCAEVFETTAELHRHLGTTHELAIHDWNAARDSLASCDACSHCGHTFSSRDGLRNHIITGRCPSFNPLATNTPLNAAQKWEMLLHTGDFVNGLSAHQRLQMTLHCELCGEVCSRSTDLSAHLQQSHGDLWTRSNEMVRFLLQTLIIRTGCRCNPCTNDPGKTHICNLVRQAAMIFYTSEQDLLVPWQFVEKDIRHVHRSISHTPHFQMLVNALLDRDFSYLWHGPALLKLFRNWCVVCGGWFHTAALVAHQLHCHHQECQWAAQIRFQLLQCMMRELQQDYQCNFCKLVYNFQHVDNSNPAEHAELQKIHLASNCPLVQQLTLTLLPIHGGHANVGSIGHGAAAVLRHPEPADDAGQPISSVKRRRTTEQKTTTRTSRSQRHGGPGEGPSEPGAAHGTSGHTTRQGHPTATSGGMLRFVRAVQPGQRADGADTTGPRMETHMGTGHGEPEVAQPPNVPLSQPDPRTSTTCGEVVPEWTRPATLGHGSEGGDHTGRWIMAVSEMVPSVQGTHHGTSQASGDGPGSERPAIPDGTLGSQRSNSTLPWGEATSHSGAMAAAGQPERTGRLADPEVLGPVNNLVHDRSIPEDPLTKPESTSTDSGNPAETSCREELGQGQNEEERLMDASRWALRHAQTNLVLENASNLCFANSAVQCFLWATLSRQNFTHSDWGATAEVFISMLQSDECPFSIDDKSWFHELVAAEGLPAGQADSAEFTSMLMRWVEPASVSCHWQRRWMQCENVLMHDLGDRFQPLTLQIHPSQMTEGMVRLTDLLRSWHVELGMQAAMVRASDLICVHIDRLYDAGPAGIQKLQIPIIFTGKISVPVFCNNGLECTWYDYFATAVFSHLGIDNAGHYQALLRQADVSGQVARSDWLHCDDCRKPNVCTMIPPGFHAGVTCIWLCREDVMELHLPHDPVVHMPGSSPGTLLQMLANSG